MTMQEVNEELLARHEKHKAEIEEQKRIRAIFDFKLAGLIGTAIGGGKGKSIYDVYPELFKQEHSWQENKASFARFAEEHNRQRRCK